MTYTIYDTAVGGALTTDFLDGGPRPDLRDREDEIFFPEGLNADAVTYQKDLLEDLVGHALELDLDPKSELDGWLAPRLHSALRIPRWMAADRRLWSWLAIQVFHPYIQARWNDERERKNMEWRYVGTLTRNGVSRLWWGAELARNGPDYGLVPKLFRRAYTAQYALELKYSWYRPAVLAFVRVAEGEEPVSADRIKPLSKRINAYLSTLALEALGPNEPVVMDDPAWRTHLPSLKELAQEELPVGPNDGAVADEALARLEAWFTDLVRGA